MNQKIVGSDIVQLSHLSGALLLAFSGYLFGSVSVKAANCRFTRCTGKIGEVNFLVSFWTNGVGVLFGIALDSVAAVDLMRAL